MKSDFAAALLICLSLINWRVLRRRPAWQRLLSAALLFCLLTAVTILMVGPPTRPSFSSVASPQLMAWQRLVVIIWWFLAARWVVQAIRAALQARSFGGEGRLLSDLLAGLVYLSTVLVIVDIVFGLSVSALVATSGVIAIVLGLALQSTLSDVFSGIAVGIEHPYSVGDRISIEGGVEGVVVQINWRAVRIRTDGDDTAIIPHSVAAKSRLINRSVPTAQRNDSVHFACANHIAPDTVTEAVRRALLLCPKILPSPSPAIALVRIGKRRNHFEIGISVAGSSDLWTSKGTLLREILRQLQVIPDAIPARHRLGNEESEVPRTDMGIMLFQVLSPEQTAELRRQAIGLKLQPGDALFSEGDAEGSLYLVRDGVMEVTHNRSGGKTVVGRISIGDYIGEIGLLTGAPHAATVTALTECSVQEFRKEHIAPLLAKDPLLLRAFEASARRGRTLLDRSVAASVGDKSVPSDELLARIRSYFRDFVKL